MWRRHDYRARGKTLLLFLSPKKQKATSFAAKEAKPFSFFDKEKQKDRLGISYLRPVVYDSGNYAPKTRESRAGTAFVTAAAKTAQSNGVWGNLQAPGVEWEKYTACRGLFEPNSGVCWREFRRQPVTSSAKLTAGRSLPQSFRFLLRQKEVVAFVSFPEKRKERIVSVCFSSALGAV